jgi:hypothetical protein
MSLRSRLMIHVLIKLPKPMSQPIKYFEVTSDRLNGSMYYAAYSLADAKDVFRSDTNSQMIGNFKEVKYTDIPTTSIVHAAKLEYADSRAVARRFEGVTDA